MSHEPRKISGSNEGINKGVAAEGITTFGANRSRTRHPLG